MWQAQRDALATASLEERADLVLTSARLLHVNGQSTEQTIAAAEHLGRALGVSTVLIPRWGELQLQAEDGASRLVTVVKADPAGIHMARVSAVMHLIESVAAGGLPAAGRVRRPPAGCARSRGCRPPRRGSLRSLRPPAPPRCRSFSASATCQRSR